MKYRKNQSAGIDNVEPRNNYKSGFIYIYIKNKNSCRRKIKLKACSMRYKIIKINISYVQYYL